MAEAVAAFYAVETAVEGAAVGAYAASRPTVPLHVKFRKLKLPDSSTQNATWRGAVGHSFAVVKGKGYIFGGDISNAEPDSKVRVVTLPSSLEKNEVDIEVIEPEKANERPLQPYSTVEKPYTDVNLKDGQDFTPELRAYHSQAVIDSNIYFVAGRKPCRTSASSDAEKNPASELHDCSAIQSFSTQTNTWSSYIAEAGRCPDGIPVPRVKASCTSIPQPEPGTGVEVTTTAHGTIFLHGGYDAEGQLLRDTWSFDVSSRSWRRWPDLPDPAPQEVAGEGKVLAHEGTICRVGDGFGKLMFLDIDVLEGDVVHASSGPHHVEVAVKPKTSEWETKTFGIDSENEPLRQSESLPMPRKGAGFVPITTGAGRFYNLYFMGQDGPGSVLRDIWSLQVKSGEKTAAAVKDAVRKAVGRGTGEYEWALCEVVESTKDDGPLEQPRALHDFATDAWTDLGGAHAVIWGGQDAEGAIRNEGWLLSAQ